MCRIPDKNRPSKVLSTKDALLDIDNGAAPASPPQFAEDHVLGDGHICNIRSHFCGVFLGVSRSIIPGPRLLHPLEHEVEASSWLCAKEE